MKYKRITRADLPAVGSREHALNEAATRADYFFRQIDGSYSFPTPDGQVSQLIEMLLAAANMPPETVTPAAVPGDVCRIEEWKSSGEWVLCDFDYRIDYIGKNHVIATTVGTPREVERVFKEVRIFPIKSHKKSG